MNNTKKLRIFIIESLLLILIKLISNDIAFVIRSRLPYMAGVLYGFFILFVDLIYIISSIALIISAFKKKTSSALIILILLLLVSFFVYIFPATDMYLNLNYNIYREERVETIEMIKNGEVTYRISNNEYVAPFKQTSCTKTILIQDENEILKVLFFVYRGAFIERIIVYTFDDSGLEADDFSSELPPDTLYKFYNIKKISPNWYSARINQ